MRENGKDMCWEIMYSGKHVRLVKKEQHSMKVGLFFFWLNFLTRRGNHPYNKIVVMKNGRKEENAYEMS